jgi:glutamate 5-kinase
LPAWKRWLGYTARPRGRLVVDAGARRAVQHQGRSLLPIGVVEVQGSFHKGDVVTLCDPEGVEFARGLSAYSSVDLQRLRGLRTEQIREALGTAPYEEVIHRDNLVVIA